MENFFLVMGFEAILSFNNTFRSKKVLVSLLSILLFFVRMLTKAVRAL